MLIIINMNTRQMSPHFTQLWRCLWSYINHISVTDQLQCVLVTVMCVSIGLTIRNNWLLQWNKVGIISQELCLHLVNNIQTIRPRWRSMSSNTACSARKVDEDTVIRSLSHLMNSQYIELHCHKGLLWKTM